MDRRNFGERQGEPLYPPHAIPYYLSDLPAEVRDQLPQPETPQQAIAVVRHNQALGTDIVKVFTGSYVTPERIVPMSLDVARAAVQARHRDHQLVFAHPSNLAGVSIAIESGVDVLAHVPDADARLMTPCCTTCWSTIWPWSRR